MAYSQDFRKRVIAFVSESRTKADTTKDWLGNIIRAQWIFLDTFGRKERITVDGIFPEITQLFDTVETKLMVV